jgi:hypothetical protein
MTVSPQLAGVSISCGALGDVIGLDGGQVPSDSR